MSKELEELYNTWIYPDPVFDIKEKIDQGWFDFGDPSLFWNLYWPKKQQQPISILIAGCGTHQAAYYAYKNTTCSVTGIDISENSLKHHQFLKEKYSLSNLQLEKKSIIELDESYVDQFDLIVSTGVLHHLEHPDLGLQKLKSCLKKDGKLNIMLYGKYPRVGVYMLQQVFKILKVGICNPDLSFVKNTLMKLPNWHFAREYFSKAGDLDNDAGLVDTFLNPIDQCYSVEDIFSFIENSGLEFTEWNDRLHYSLDALIGGDTEFGVRADALSNVEKYKLVELITQQLATHRFIVSHPHNSNRVEISSENYHLVVPELRHGVVLENNSISRGYHRLTVTDPQFRLLIMFSKKFSLFELSQESNIDFDNLTAFINQLADCGHVFLTEKSEPTIDSLVRAQSSCRAP